MLMLFRSISIALLTVASSVPAYAQVDKTGSPFVRPLPDDSLYRELGGAAGVRAVVDEFVSRVAADGRIAPFFRATNIDRLKTTLNEQICAVAGGGCRYTGRDMASSHRGLGIDRAAFNALVEALQAALDARGVPFGTQARLLAQLAPMHREIITR